MSNYLLSFGDQYFKYQKLRLRREAERTGWFADVIIHSPESISDFLNEHKEFVANSRGYGYWIWKPYIILEQLKKINDGDILVYIDSGGSVLSHRKNRFDQYIEMLNQTDKPIITFYDGGSYGEIQYQEKFFQKMGTLKRFNLEADEEFLNSGQVEGGVFICKKTDFSVSFVQEWFNLLVENNYALVIDEDNFLQREDFICHRHDQSILSILCKLHRTILISLSDCYGNGPFFSSRLTDSGLREKAPDGFRKESNYDDSKHYNWKSYLEDEKIKQETLNEIKKIFSNAKEELVFHDIDYDLKNEFVRRVFKQIEKLQFNRGLYKIKLIIDEYTESISVSREKIIGEFYCEFSKEDEYKFNFIITPEKISFPEDQDYNKRLYTCEYMRQWNCNY